MQKIIIVEDDKKIREELYKSIVSNGYDAVIIDDFNNLANKILKLNASLILLDLGLPKLDGKYVCKQIRKTSNVPIIIVTSINNEIDELVSLNYGADDYVTKPFNINILIAKISAILRRTNIVDQTKIDCGDFVLNISNSTIEKNGEITELTKNELKILCFLSKNKEKIVSRDDIMMYLWDSKMFVDDNTLNVNIARIRNKLDELGVKDMIETKRGQGYVLK